MRDVQFTSGDGADSPLGDGTALVMGGSSIPIPPQSYVNAADTLYLQPRDFTGTPQALDTPEGFYPTTGVNSLTADASEAQGAQILNGAITGQIADGNVDAANPVVVFGYSQSFYRVRDRPCTQEKRERDQRDIGRDRIADRAEQAAGLELVSEQGRVEGGQRSCQRIDGVCDRQQSPIISRQSAGDVVDDIDRWRKQSRVGNRDTAAE